MGEYSEGVLVGDWNEKLLSRQAALNQFIQRKKSNSLLTQKSAKIKQNLLREVQISVQPDGIVRYGDTVQIVNPEFNTAMSSVISHRDVYNVQDLQVGCVLSGSKNQTPCVRNVFKIASLDPDNELYKPLRYGDDFYLITTHDEQAPLYVQSEIPNMNSTMGISKHPRVTLIANRNSHCRWSILSYNKNERDDLINCVVHANVPIRINHSASNQQLALESQHKFYTIFGVEHEISVHTYMNIHKFEKIENAWIISAPEHKLELQ